MKTNLRYLLCLLVSVLLIWTADAANNNKGSTDQNRLRKGTGTPASTILDINNMTTWVRNDGLFYPEVENSWNGTFPKGTIGDVYAQGIVWGGFVHDGQSPDLRVGGSTYSTGCQGGSILTDASGNVTGAEDPTSSSVRIFRVRPDVSPQNPSTADLRDDAANLLKKPLADVTDDDMNQLRQQYVTDWNEWPVLKGAPFNDVNGNGTYEPSVDIPGIPGADQTVFYVANDLGPNANVYGAPSIGFEMQMTIWAYSSELFSNIQFKRVRIIYKGSIKTPPGSTIDGLYFVQWADPDDGDYSDDFAGCDTSLSLGYVYNGNPQDRLYQSRFGLPPPAVGFVFSQGPMIPGSPTDTAIFNFEKVPGHKNLPMTTFVTFVAGSQRSDPDLNAYSGTLQWYNLMRACEPRPQYPTCTPITDLNGNATHFELSGDPVAGTGDLDGRKFPPGDRRIVLATGPFTMAKGDTQEMVVGQVNGLGGDNISSVAVMKNNAKFAIQAYKQLFKSLPGAPPPPIVKTTPLNNEILLNWGTDPDQISTIENANRQGWQFEGYNVYQVPSPSTIPTRSNLIATYDLTADEDITKFGKDVLAITNKVFDPTAKITIDQVREVGTDNGIKRYIDITKDAVTGRPLVNGLTYYFAVTAYAYNPDPSVDFHALESPATIIPVIPQSPNPGVRIPESVGRVIALDHTAGSSAISPTVTVVDPTKLTGHNYKFIFKIDTTGQFAWVLQDSTLSDSVIFQSTNFGSAASGFSGSNFDFPIVDGMLVQVIEKTPVLTGNWVSSHTQWFDGNRFTADPSAGFNGGVTTGAQLPNYLGHVSSNFNPFLSVPVEFRFDPANPQKAYRLRRTGPHGGYMIQSSNSFVDVPFTAWDVSDIAHPRQLTLAWRDQDRSGTWNPPIGSDDGLEIVFVLYRTYDPLGTQFHLPPNAVEDEITTADVMYGLSLGVLDGHTLSESVGTLAVAPDKHLGLSDVFTFSTQAVSTSSSLAVQDVQKINVFPNPYFGFNTQETNRLNKFVTFNHLPARAIIRIFNLAGVLVVTLDKNDPSQFMRWNLRNENNLPVASGIYIVYIDMPDVGTTKTLKLALIQEAQVLPTY